MARKVLCSNMLDAMVSRLWEAQSVTRATAILNQALYRHMKPWNRPGLKAIKSFSRKNLQIYVSRHGTKT